MSDKRSLRALYLPKAWTDAPARMKAAHVPAETCFATKPAIAGAMIARALAAQAPFGWVAADSVYGVGSLETTLRRAGKGYVLGVGSNHRINSWGKARPIAETAGAVAQDLPPSDWVRLSAGEGTKGARLHDWAYLELADLDSADYGSACSGLWTRGLLIRRKIADGDLAFFSTWCPAGTPVETLRRWKGIAGPSRTASRPPRTNSASTITRRAPGMMAPACLAGYADLRDDGEHPSPREQRAAPKMKPGKALRRWPHAP